MKRLFSPPRLDPVPFHYFSLNDIQVKGGLLVLPPCCSARLAFLLVPPAVRISAVTRLESLRFGSGDEGESLQSPAKKHQADKGDAAADGVSVARRYYCCASMSSPDNNRRIV